MRRTEDSVEVLSATMAMARLSLSPYIFFFFFARPCQSLFRQYKQINQFGARFTHWIPPGKIVALQKTKYHELEHYAEQKAFSRPGIITPD